MHSLFSSQKMNIFIRTLFWQILKAMIPSEDQDDLDVCVEINAGVGGQEAMLFCLDIFNMYLSYADFMGWDADVTSYETTDIGMSLPMVYCLHVLAVIIISISLFLVKASNFPSPPPQCS